MSDPVADLIATAQPVTEDVEVCARGDLVAKHRAAVALLHEAQKDDDSLTGNGTIEAAAGVKDVEDEIDAASLTVTLTTISRNALADLLALHPPTREERRVGHQFNLKSFPAALVSACAVEPKITEDQATTLCEKTLSAGEWNRLWDTAWLLNTNETPRPKLAAATEILQANGSSSTTSDHGGSPEGGSLAGSGAQ